MNGVGSRNSRSCLSNICPYWNLAPLIMIYGKTVVAAFLASLVTEAHGHGYISKPIGRNGNMNGANQPGAVCGGDRYLSSFRGIQATYSAGQVVEFAHVITAHHFGHLEMSICDRRINSSVADPSACLRRWRLERVAPPADCRPNDSRTDCQPVDKLHPERFYLPPRSRGRTHKFRYRIPSGLNCAECTLQWRWWTANSCVPAEDYGCYWDQLTAAGWSTRGFHGYYSGKPCGSSRQPMCNNNGEQFVNCADIKVLRSGAPAPPTPPTPPAPTPTPAPPTPPAPTPTPVTPAPTPPPAVDCGSCTQCLANNGVCYTQPESWCNLYPTFTWCGSALVQTQPHGHSAAEQRLRGHPRLHE